MAANLAKLENLRLRDTWQQLLRIDDADGIDATLEKVVDGDSVECPLYLSSTKVQIKPTTDASDVFKVSQAGGDAVLTIDTTLRSVSEGWGSLAGDADGAYGGKGAHAEGVATIASGQGSHSQGTSCTASGYNSHAGGNNSNATFNEAFAQGNQCNAHGLHSIAMGASCQAGPDSAGEGNTGVSAFAIGGGCTAEFSHSIAMGRASEARAMRAVAIGDHAEALGMHAHSFGFYTKASGSWSEAIGDYSEATGDHARAYGRNTEAQVRYSVADGFYSKTTGDAEFARADGYEAHADKFGQRAWQTRRMEGSVDYGTAQESRYMLHAKTTDDTQTEMFLDGASGSQRMTIESDSTWLFHVRIVARQTNADDVSAGYELKGVIDNNAGTTALASSLTKVEIGEDVAGWDVTAVADNTNDALVVKVTGAIGDSVNWVGFVNTVETIG